jgi:hypothetical protein
MAISIASLIGPLAPMRNAMLPATPLVVSTDRTSAMPAMLSSTMAISATNSATPRWRCEEGKGCRRVMAGSR